MQSEEAEAVEVFNGLCKRLANGNQTTNETATIAAELFKGIMINRLADQAAFVSSSVDMLRESLEKGIWYQPPTQE